MSTTLSQIRTQAGRYLGGTTASARWSSSDVDGFINEGIRWLQSEIQQSNVDYFVRTDTATASAGSYQLSLPTNIMGEKLRGLYVFEQSTVATGEGTRMEPGQMEWVLTNSDYSGTPLNYTMMAGYLRFAPMLQYDSAFRFVYAKKESTLTNDTDPLDRIADEHVDVIAMYASMVAFDQLGLDAGTLPSRLERRLGQVMGDIQSIDPIVIPQVAID